ncbi:MAG: trimethylamine methyltransferase family protein [Roseibium sp.]|uniref:trimethylamine methyltransferase family protein n=1 Tax=Roseibium sp. TaxID=1936156 RepID=UPI001B079BEA|nr:trimethylamine methyltransferase family protein [Roseibium sp.]MBO6892787.1 trimethylamine methyltransferase family protein [Roseibium sp.]MBO6928494.1 trimethylamine methyltransferase family protein [Roseibium sp.]
MTGTLDTSISNEAPSSRRGRRRRGGEKATPNLFPQKPFRQPRHIFRPIEAISADELESIDDASMRVLEEIGMDFLHEEAKALLKEAGADIKPGDDRVRMDRGLVEELIAKAPSEFTLHARNRNHNLQIGGDAIVFSCVASAPNVVDRDGGRRPGNRQDFGNLLRLAQFFNIIHAPLGYPVEPVDIHASVRHLDCIADAIRLTDKALHLYSLGRERNLDGIELARIANGLTPSELVDTPCILTVINTSSPLRLDTPMLQGLIEMARAGQVSVVTPFTLAGAMAPVTVAGALTLQNAEALAGIAFAQLVRPGAPVVYGGFTSNVDMKSGAPAFGTPEYMKAALVSGQLARRYRLPFRSSGVCAANTVDYQAALETTLSEWGAINGGGNIIKHAAGWLEGGLSAGFEKFIADIDLLQKIAEYLTPLDVSGDSLALDAIRDVGPAGHFFGTEHTQARYKDAFYPPIVSDWRNYETWAEAGAPIAYDKANMLYKKALEAYEQPAIDPAINEEITAFVERRKSEGGAPTDF